MNLVAYGSDSDSDSDDSPSRAPLAAAMAAKAAAKSAAPGALSSGGAPAQAARAAPGVQDRSGARPAAGHSNSAAGGGQGVVSHAPSAAAAAAAAGAGSAGAGAGASLPFTENSAQQQRQEKELEGGGDDGGAQLHPCSDELQAKFRRFAELRESRGVNFNSTLTQKKDFRNPELLGRVIDRFEIDPTGTQFPPELWDPRDGSSRTLTAHPSDFYDSMAADVKRLLQAREEQMRHRSSVEFVGTGGMPSAGLQSAVDVAKDAAQAASKKAKFA